MIAFTEIQNIVDNMRSALSSAALSHQLTLATRRLGFDYFALAQRDHARVELQGILLTDLPANWLSLLAKDYFYAHDPILVALQSSATPFVWGDMENFMAVNDRHRAYMKLAADNGIAQGITVPIHVPGEPSALCSFSMTDSRPLPLESLPVAQYIASSGFEAARKLRDATALSANPMGLTDLQRNILVQIARGKSRQLISRTLKVTPAQIGAALKVAQRRYRVASSTEVIVQALYDKTLSFHEIMN